MEIKKLLTLMVIWVFISLPIATAFTISVPIEDVGSNSATITWETDVLSDSEVEYGMDSIDEESESSSSDVLEHSITLTGLEEKTKYYYRVVVV